MALQLKDINFRTVSDPKEFLAECDAEYMAKVNEAAERIIAHKVLNHTAAFITTV